jgi:acetylglutamate kinase
MRILYLVKVGGNILDDGPALERFLYDLSQLKGLKMLVHGGGKLATELAAKLNVDSKMIDGRRVTDAATLRIATMVYAGWINKSLVARLQAFHCNALGLTGADGKCILTRKRAPAQVDYGYVGDLVPGSINTSFLHTLLECGTVPVIAPITCNTEGQLLNTNADTIAAHLAAALSEYYQTHLIYCFEKKGVLMDRNNENSVISRMDSFKYEILKSEKRIADGMIPKLENAFRAKQEGVNSVVIGHAFDLLNLVNAPNHAGTYIQQ